MIEKYNYEGDSSLGFYTNVTNEQALFPPKFKRKEFFSGKKHETYIAKTRLIGLYTAGNSSSILIPENTTEHEIKKLEKSEINYTQINSKENALGNLILANDKGALISEKLESHKEKIAEALNVPLEIGRIADLPSPGVCAAANNKGALLHREAKERDAEIVKKALKIQNVDIGTVNLGSPYIGSGLIGNDEKILVGEDTTGPEIGRIDRTMHSPEKSE